MSKFYSVDSNDIEYVATSLRWFTETNIGNNVAYKRAFGKQISQHTDMGVSSFYGSNIVTVGIVDKKEDLISNPRNAVALAPSLKLATRYHTGGEIVLENELADHDLFNCFVCKLNNESYYACGFIDERIIFDFDLGENVHNIAEKIAGELSDNILFDTEKYALSIHYIGCDETIPAAVKHAVHSLREYNEEQLVIAKELSLEITLSELLNEVPKSELLFVKNIARLSQSSSSNERLVSLSIGTIVVLVIVWWFFLKTPDKPQIDQATLDKYALPEQSEFDDPINQPANVPEYDPIEDENSLRQMAQEEQGWIELAIRKNGYKPLTHLGKVLTNLEYSVNGFVLDEITYEDAFAPTNSTLIGEITAKYNRADNSTIEEFLKRYPDAQITLDGEMALLKKEFPKSSHEKRFWFGSNKVKLETLISRLQRLKDDKQIFSWNIRADDDPQRPRSYTSKEQSLMARMGITESAKEEDWVTNFDVYRVEVTFRYVTNLPNLEAVFEGFPTALLSNFKYQTRSQTATIEVQLYDIQ